MALETISMTGISEWALKSLVTKGTRVPKTDARSPLVKKMSQMLQAGVSMRRGYMCREGGGLG